MKRNLGALVSIIFIVLIIGLPVYVFLQGDKLNLLDLGSPVITENKEVKTGNYYDFGEDVNIEVDNDNVVSIKGGRIDFTNTGTVTVTTTDKNNVKKKYIFTVTAEPEDPGEKPEVVVKELTLDKTSVTLKVGQNTKLTVKITPSDAKDKSLVWKTSDSTIATVDNGKIKAIKEGTAKITVMSANGVTAECDVTVKPKAATPVTPPKPTPPSPTKVEVKAIKLGKTSLTLYVGETEEIRVSIEPSNATDKTLVWSSSNRNVVSTQGNRLIANGEGSATVTVKSSNGVTSTIKVTVKGNGTTVEPPSNIAVTGVTLGKKSTTIKVGYDETISAVVAPSNATNKKLTWVSSNVNVATVNQSGKITGVKEGKVTVTAEAHNGVKGSIEVTITKAADPTVAVTSVSLSKTSTTIYVGNSETITATVKPSNATNKNITWTSSDNSIATVSNGKITGVKAGTATITAKSNNGKTATCTVTIKKTPDVTVPVTSVTLNKTSLTLTKGSEDTLKATISPSDATNKTLTWSSSDASIVRVLEGKITALKKGTAVITVKSSNGKKATCTVTVKESTVAVTSVSLNKTKLTLTEGASESLVATISPGNATDKTLTWSSSNTSVAKVSNGKVTAVKKGTATITVKSNNGKTATCTVTVKEQAPQEIAVSSVSLNKTKLTLTIGKSETLVATISPSNATNKTLTWSTSDASVAKVSNGKVTAVKAGTASIIVKSNNGKTATCTVTVKKESSTLDITTKVPDGYSELGDKSYSSSTLKYKAIKNKSEDEYITMVWVEDANLQLNNGSSGLVGGKKQARAHMNYEINQGKQTKGMVGTNGGFAWGYYDNIPVLASNGSVKRNTGYQSWHWNGNRGESLKYGTLGINSKGELISRNVSNDDLINVGSFTNDNNRKEKISETGYQNFEKWISDNGVRNTWGITHFKTSGWDSTAGGSDPRTALCQVDEHNFVIAVNHYISVDKFLGRLHNLFGCKIAINMDGGGSSGMYYKTSTMTSAGTIREYTRGSETTHRDIVDILYFVEK